MGGTDNQQLVQLLAASEQILIFTGAGISTGSGIPDYRGPQGIWKQRQPVYYQDFMRSEAARIEYWDYKLQGWEGFRDARPNAVHQAIVELEQAHKICAVITQNIDGLHTKAGTTAERLIELHGTNLAVECQSCWKRTPPAAHFESFKHTGTVPVCKKCGGFLKPATISFGQNLRQEDLTRASEAAAATDLVIALGSTLLIHPAASLPLMAANRGVPYVIINRGATEHDGHCDLTLRMDGDVVSLFPPAVKQALEPGN